MAQLPPELHQIEALLTAGRQAEAISETQRLSLQGMPAAVMLMGQMKWSGMVAQDPPGARKLFERASDLGDATAAAFATNLLASGVAGERDWPRALARLAKEAANDPDRARALTQIEAMTLDFAGDPVALPDAEVVSERPRIRIYRQLFKPAECDYVLKVADGLYQPSMVYNSARQLVRDPIRTSDGATLHWLAEDPAIHALLRRIGKATGTDATQGEASQVLRYKPGQEYKPHYDYLRASENQRIVTALVWLNDDYQGGETAFLRTGQKLRGKKGDAVVFWNSLEVGSIDPLTEHAGLPVQRGTKLLFNRWIRASRWQP